MKSIRLLTFNTTNPNMERSFERSSIPRLCLIPKKMSNLQILLSSFGRCLMIPDTGLFILVKDYECVIDTGSAPPIAVKGINYGPHETPIICANASLRLKSLVISTKYAMVRGCSKLSLLL
jgi:hypothetical protein